MADVFDFSKGRAALQKKKGRTGTLDKLNRLDRSTKLDHINKLDNINTLDNITKLNNINKLETSAMFDKSETRSESMTTHDQSGQRIATSQELQASTSNIGTELYEYGQEVLMVWEKLKNTFSVTNEFTKAEALSVIETYFDELFDGILEKDFDNKTITDKTIGRLNEIIARSEELNNK